MKNIPELYILRHGETEWNASDRLQGWLNSSLTSKGLKDAARQGEILAKRDLRGFKFYSSPSGRAVQTAAIACGPLAREIHTDPRLREIGVGEWAGKFRSDLPDPGGPAPILAQYSMAPGGEGLTRLKDRVRKFLEDLQGPAVVITHGVTSYMIRNQICGDAVVRPDSIHGGQGGVFHLKEEMQTFLE